MLDKSNTYGEDGGLWMWTAQSGLKMRAA